MAINGPLVSGDLEVIAILDALRLQEDFVAKTASFTVGTREAAGYIVTSASAVTATLPAANSTDLKVGAKFYFINDGSSVGVLSIAFNSSGTLGSLAVGESALVVLKTNSDANGTWELIQLDKDEGVTKYSATFNSDISPTANASWTAASNGVHTYNVTVATHGRGTLPIVEVFRGASTGTQTNVLVKIEKTTTGNISVIVTQTPSGVFAGTIVIT